MLEIKKNMSRENFPINCPTLTSTMSYHRAQKALKV